MSLACMHMSVQSCMQVRFHLKSEVMHAAQSSSFEGSLHGETAVLI